jgi:hypothetical protein
MKRTEYVNFLDTLFDMIKDQDDALNLIDGTKEELLLAYDAGSKSQQSKEPFEANPHPEIKETTYNCYIAWAEGWMHSYLEVVNNK